MKIKHIGSLSFVVLWAWLSVAVAADQVPQNALAVVDQQIAAHPSQSGIYVLDKGEEALIARAWLADHAQKKTIEVQYLFGAPINPTNFPLQANVGA